MKARRNELTAAQGRKLIAEMVTISSGEQMGTHTTREWFEEWVANKKASAGERAVARYRSVLKDSWLTWAAGRMRRSLQSRPRISFLSAIDFVQKAEQPKPRTPSLQRR